MRCRRVAVSNEEKRRNDRDLMNIGPEALSAEEAAVLYSMRWAVELCFRGSTFPYARDEFLTTNANIVGALVWTAPLTLVVSRRLHNLVRRRASPALRPRYPQRRQAIRFREARRYLRGLALAHPGLKPFSETEPWIAHPGWTENTLGRNVHRYRLGEVWPSGSPLNCHGWCSPTHRVPDHARVKAARAVVATTPGLAEILRGDGKRAAKFSARYGIPEGMFRYGVPAGSVPGKALTNASCHPMDTLAEGSEHPRGVLPSAA